jgi:hypothetical protein
MPIREVNFRKFFTTKLTHRIQEGKLYSAEFDYEGDEMQG